MRRPFFLACVLSFAVMLILSMDTLPTYLIQLKEDYVTLWAGGDLVIKSPYEIKLPKVLEDDQSVVAQSIKLSTMLRKDEQAYLIHLQLVSPEYPLYGQLEIKREQSTSSPGVMVSRTLMRNASLSIGDQVSIGDQFYVVEGVVERQDEQVYDFDSFSPSVYMSYDEKDKIGLIDSTARYHHYIYIKADKDHLSFIQQRLSQLLPVTSKLIVPQQSLGRVERIYDQFLRVLEVVRILGYLLVGCLLYLSIEHYQRQILNDIGVLKVIGYNFRQRLWYFVRPLIGLCTIGYIMGGIIGSLVLFVLLLYTDSSYLDQLPYGWMLWRSGSVYALFLLLLIPFRALMSTLMPTNQLLKAKHHTNYVFMLLLGITIIALLLSVTRWSFVSFLYALSVSLLTLSIGSVLAYGVLSSLIFLLSHGKQRVLLCLNGLRLYQQEHTFTVMFITLLLSVCIIIWHIGFQTVTAWSDDLPDDAANTFIVGMQESQLPSLQESFDWFSKTNLYPIVKGRLLKVNNQEVIEYQGGIYKDHEAFNRQINLTTVENLPDRNTIIEGEWSAKGISADSGIMNRLGLQLGDQLTFLLYGELVTLPITSVRKVDWQSMRANFYFMFPQNSIDKYPKSYMTSVYLSDEDRQMYLFSQLSPSSTIISIDEFIKQARDFTARITRLSYVLLVTIVSFSVISLVFVMLNQISQRKEQMSIMAYLGYDPRRHPVVLIEMMVMATLSSIFGAILSYLAVDAFNNYLGVQWYVDQQSVIFIILLYMMILFLSKVFQRIVERDAI